MSCTLVLFSANTVYDLYSSLDQLWANKGKKCSRIITTAEYWILTAVTADSIRYKIGIGLMTSCLSRLGQVVATSPHVATEAKEL